MALIFDQFPTQERAEAFVAAVKERHELRGSVYESQDEMNEAFVSVEAAEGRIVDVFPFQLDGLVALIERDEFADERAIEASVAEFGGRFAGT